MNDFCRLQDTLSLVSSTRGTDSFWMEFKDDCFRNKMSHELDAWKKNIFPSNIDKYKHQE